MSIEPPESLTSRLGFLLKHVWLAHAELSAAALKPLGIDGRELAVLTVLGEGDALSQHDAAKRLGIDRTTMVAMLDALADKDLIARRQHPEDRRRNIVELTASGRRAIRQGTRISADVEQRFLAPLGARDSQRFRDALHALISGRK
jgi:DNA-binding MarR family transcriptional regulator